MHKVNIIYNVKYKRYQRFSISTDLNITRQVSVIGTL